MTKAKKRSKRVVFTASVQTDTHDRTGLPIIAREFFTFPAPGCELDANAARTIFARRRKIDPETVTVTSEPERKPSYKPSFKRTSSEDAATYNDRRAIEYARWLARRDGVSVADDTPGQAQHGFVTIDGRHQRRVCAVDFGRHVYRDVPTMYRGRMYMERVKVQESVVTIAIPHWDWTPAAPVEETLPETPVAPSFDLIAA